jgi:hypothetical protein
MNIQVVLAAEVMTSGGDFRRLEPMLDAPRRKLQAIGVEETPGVVLADAGYWHERQMERADAQGSPGAHPPDISKGKTPSGMDRRLLRLSCAASWPASAAASFTGAASR